MGFTAVILATVAAFAFGALWYGLLSGPWKHDSGVLLGDDGNPANAKSPTPYITCALCLLFVAGFLRLLLDAVGVTGLMNAIQWGTGVGLFFITPWIILNYGYSMRPFRLGLIDGGYATIGCAIMAAVIWLLAPTVA